MNIRPAETADAAAICAIWNPQIANTSVTFNALQKSAGNVAEMIRARRADGHEFFVAEHDGTVLGFASYGQFRGGIGYAKTMEHTVILSENARGQGLGSALMRVVEDHAREGGAHSMVAGVSCENLGAIAFHTALGYAQVAVLPEAGRKFDRWMDLHLMQKFL